MTHLGTPSGLPLSLAKLFFSEIFFLFIKSDIIFYLTYLGAPALTPRALVWCAMVSTPLETGVRIGNGYKGAPKLLCCPCP